MDRYANSSQGLGESQSVTLTNTGGSTTNSVCDTTMSGPFNSTDADTGNAPDSTSVGTDKSSDSQQDKDQATITLTQDGTLDSSGNLTITGGEGDEDGGSVQPD